MSLLHLYSERGVNTVVEVQIGGAVVGSVRNPQVTVSDPTVQLLLYSEILHERRSIHNILQDTAGNITESVFLFFL